jgi:hypothetical protein
VCRIRVGFLNEGNEGRQMEAKVYFRKGRPAKARAISDIQVNRSAEVGNKTSIYCAIEWLGESGGWTLRIERERCSVYPAPENGTCVIHLTRALNVLRHLLCVSCL